MREINSEKVLYGGAMPLFRMAPQRASYTWRRGRRAKELRNARQGHREHIRMLSNVREQAVAAGADRDVMNIDLAILEHTQWLEEHR